MKLAAIISVILIMVLIYRIGEMRKSKGRLGIYIIIFLGTIIINGFILYDYVQVKGVHNYSTYITYQNVLDGIQNVAQYELEEIDDIQGFSDAVDRLNVHVSLLGFQIDEASLIKGSKKDIISSLDSLSLELHAFSNYQKGIFIREDSLPDDSISLYNEFKLKVADLKNVLEVKEDKLGGNFIGIVQYSLKPERGQLKELGTIVNSISEVNSRLMKL